MKPADSLLHQFIPEELREEWAVHLAVPLEPPVRERIPLLVFRLGVEKFGISARRVEEIVPPGVIRPLPHSGNGVLRGVTNVNGRIRTCVWLERLLKTAPSAPAPLPRLLVFKHGSWRIAALVDEVLGVREFHAGQQRQLPATHAEKVISTGWFGDDGEIIARLDETALFDALRRQLT